MTLLEMEDVGASDFGVHSLRKELTQGDERNGSNSPRHAWQSQGQTHDPSQYPLNHMTSPNGDSPLAFPKLAYGLSDERMHHQSCIDDL